MRYFAAMFVLFIALSPSAQTLTVHEWGTFTTLRGSDGSILSGLYIEEEQLPPFVYHHPGFSPDPIIQTNGYRPVKDVIVKMETPVLYFYSPKEQNVKVHVDFPNGTISQWYPERSGGEISPTSDTLDLGKPMTGSIDWDVTVLKGIENRSDTKLLFSIYRRRGLYEKVNHTHFGHYSIDICY